MILWRQLDDLVLNKSWASSKNSTKTFYSINLYPKQVSTLKWINQMLRNRITRDLNQLLIRSITSRPKWIPIPRYDWNCSVAEHQFHRSYVKRVHLLFNFLGPEPFLVFMIQEDIMLLKSPDPERNWKWSEKRGGGEWQQPRGRPDVWRLDTVQRNGLREGHCLKYVAVYQVTNRVIDREWQQVTTKYIEK